MANKKSPVPRKTSSPKPKERRTLQEADLKRVPWRSIGPAIMGGRIADMAFVPGDTKSWYIGFASGGVWRTTNNGTTFEQLFKNEETSSIGALAVADAPAKWGGWGKDVLAIVLSKAVEVSAYRLWKRCTRWISPT